MAGQNTLTPLGKKIKKRLVDLDMTQRQLAASLGVNPVYITKIMNGSRTGAKYREQIAEILKMDELHRR
ncbi:helix-turn-helix domain-containing protein [Parablautia sp. Marseille-Q6255]|mgnify:CR=1 FL=1|uniref:helix-turn-helix domain-containing protein n=1 Tax=Parablautia sp. Marseille-Q6255 TaxID=3039593 RepID=UPI0024BC0E6A|nr:helix-turn-helix transcriptional regulator [Parablautia sp. Marseille-Q6255]